jgi:flagellar hook protein FlgE
MDVIGNNISNVNTVGFKASRVIFQDIYSQTVAPASAATANTGGTNPQQIGLGVQLGTIDVLDAESSSQYTGNTLDLAIDGDGYFVIQDGGSYTYTRAGNFYTDSQNYL